MATATKTVSIRLPTVLLNEATELSPSQRVSEIINQALQGWVAARRRQHEDDLIRRAIASVPSERRREERELVELAGQSSLKVLDKLDG